MNESLKLFIYNMNLGCLGFLGDYILDFLSADR
jgi:hypothetical protein